MTKLKLKPVMLQKDIDIIDSYRISHKWKQKKVM